MSKSSSSEQGAINCKHCLSQFPKEFAGELAIHFSGLAGLNKPIVWVFPKLLVCSQCGFTEFTVPERELQVLRDEAPVEGAIVWMGGNQKKPKI